MIKKLDKLIIRAFIGPFIATFFITLLVLVMQFFWLYIDDFVGKGISTGIILEFIWYQMAVLVPLALPLAILLSSIMTFGNLGESFELVAIKSAGISLLRFMRPLFFVTLFICGIAFLFSNYIIPIANLKSRTLLADIVYAKPSFALQEGVFYDKISGFAIKVGKKEANDSVIRDVIVYEQGNPRHPLQDNFIIAKTGIMRVSENKRFLEFNLRDGWYYQERGDNTQGSEYIRIGFKEFKKQFDLSGLGFEGRTPDSLNKNNEKMRNMAQLETAIDSLEKENRQVRTQMEFQMLAPLHFSRNLDTVWAKQTIPDSIKSMISFDQLLPDSAKESVNQRTREQINLAGIGAETLNVTMREKERNLRKHKIEWHRKIALSLACLVLFLIGAPLGSIIRKGGLGTPLIFAIGFFMIFYFSTTTGEKFAKENTMSPFAGMWLSTFVLVPIGLFLIYKAMHDSQFLNKEFYHRFIKTVVSYFRHSS
jgi:lipopolysaccharide export system permease protein